MGLFNYGEFTLHSGGANRFKIDCNALTVTDLKALAWMAWRRLPRFGGVVGVPYGGLAFATALSPYACHPAPWLVVDDVLTTGRSMEEARQKLDTVNGPVLGLVIFARGPCPDWVVPLFSLSPEKSVFANSP